MTESEYDELVNKIKRAMERNCLPEAYENASLLGKVFPGKIVPLILLGDICRKSQNLTEAILNYERALAISPESIPAHAGMADISMKLGNPVRAVKHYLEICRDSARCPQWARIGLANAYEKTGEFDKALCELHQAIEMRPTATLWNRIGEIHSLQGEHELAAKSFLHQVAATPGPGEKISLLITFGNDSLRKMHFDKAYEYFNNALSIAGGDSDQAVFGLSDALIGLQRPAEAIACLKNAPARIRESLAARIRLVELESPDDAGLERARLFSNDVIVTESDNNINLISRLAAVKKLVILCSFTPTGRLYAYHKFLAQSFQELGYIVLWVHSLPEQMDVLQQDGIIKDFADVEFYIFKKNKGYDFGSWFSGFVKVAEAAKDIEELIFVNDSVFGPVFDLAGIVDRMRKNECDAWGIVDSFEKKYHLQSFFLCFKKRMLHEGALLKFLCHYNFPDNKPFVIDNGEVALSRFLIDQQYNIAAAFPYSMLAEKWIDNLDIYKKEISSITEKNLHSEILNDEDSAEARKDDSPEDYMAKLYHRILKGEPVNPMHFFADVLLDNGCPFIKREFLFKNTINSPLHYRMAKKLKSLSDYPHSYIQECSVKYGSNRTL